MSDIPWSKLTHAIHFQMHPADGSGNIFGIPGSNADTFTASAHAAGVRAILSLGDSNGSNGLFSSSISNNLNGFVNNVVNFVNTHNYDGVDLDWEAGNYRSADLNSYINLINALRNALGSKTLTMAVYWHGGLEQVVQATYSKLDQINVMCYDMDQWISYTFYNSAEFLATGDNQNGACAAQAAAFTPYAPAAKIGLGIPFYGRVTSGCSDSSCSDGLHDPLQTWSGSPSITPIAYRDLINSPYWSYPHQWDSTRGASFISVNQPGAGNDRFISFTGDQQINSLVQLAKGKGYGGVMEYEVEFDFVLSESGDARHPLAAATYAAVFGSQAPAPPPIVTAPPPVNTSTVGGSTGTGITTGNLLMGDVGVLYSQALDCTFAKPITWSIISGGLPSGITLNSSTGVISGMTLGFGTWTFTVLAASSGWTATETFSILFH